MNIAPQTTVVTADPALPAPAHHFKQSLRLPRSPEEWDEANTMLSAVTAASLQATSAEEKNSCLCGDIYEALANCFGTRKPPYTKGNSQPKLKQHNRALKKVTQLKNDARKLRDWLRVLPPHSLSPPSFSLCSVTTAASNAIIRAARRDKRSLAVAWLDIANAYGSVHYSLIQFSLRHYHTPPEFCALMQSMYTGLSATITTKDWCTAPVPLEIGVYQGDPFSMAIFLTLTSAP